MGQYLHSNWKKAVMTHDARAFYPQHPFTLYVVVFMNDDFNDDTHEMISDEILPFRPRVVNPKYLLILEVSASFKYRRWANTK